MGSYAIATWNYTQGAYIASLVGFKQMLVVTIFGMLFLLLFSQLPAILSTRYGIDISGSKIYITTQPCITCAKMCINAGITEIIYANPYPDELSLGMLDEAGIPYRVFELGE